MSHRKNRSDDLGQNVNNSTSSEDTVVTSSIQDDPPHLEGELVSLRNSQKLRRQRTKLLRSPFSTLKFFGIVCWDYIIDVALYFRSHTKILFSLAFFLVHFGVLYFTEGNHQPMVERIESWLITAGWWIGLGILSSVGLGSGLHTFVLYLGPHIALVTLAAYECNTLNFDVYGPNRFTCPVGVPDGEVTFFQILRKVELEAFLWGAGTAIGELPPYFVARAARLAGEKVSELDEIEAAASGAVDTSNFMTRIMSRGKKFMFSWLGNLGFFGILMFASIPNPLFDLAGITCGHFLVPFWTFFGATLIGKAVIKSHLQTAFVITMFSKTLLDYLVKLIERLLPFARDGIEEFMAKEREKLHRHTNGPQHTALPSQKSVLALGWDLFLVAMLAYFLSTLIESSVQHHLSKRDDIEAVNLEQKIRKEHAKRSE